MTITGFAGRLRVDRPLVGRVGLRRFPRHYSNIRWRAFIADRRFDAGWDHTDPETSGRRYDAGWVI